MLPQQTYVRNSLWRTSASVAQSPADVIRSLHGFLLLLVLPFTVLWIPMVRVPELGTLTVQDALLFALAITTPLLFGVKARKSREDYLACRIAILAIIPPLFGMLGANIFDAQSRLTTEILQHAKRFGLPSILPLAMLVSPPRLVPRIRIMAVLSLLFMAVTPYTPLLQMLPITEVKVELATVNGEARESGSVSNPNDFSCIAFLGALIGLSHAAVGNGRRLTRRLWAAAAVVAGLEAIVVSASRSGMTAASIAVAYIISRSRLGYIARFWVVLTLIAAALIGWQLSSVYRDRMAILLEEKASEPNAVARVEAQSVAFDTWLHHPLGVGFVNMPTATAEFSGNSTFITEVVGSDSIYFDFLLATGVFGFSCIIICFHYCWKIGNFRPAPADIMCLKAAILATFCFGLTSVSPASYSVAPFFFTVVGLAACLRRSHSTQRLFQ